MGKIITCDNFLEPELLNELIEYYRHKGHWKLNNTAGDLKDPLYDRLFWSAHVKDQPLFTERVFNCIVKKFGNNYFIEDVYLNGQTKGQEGNWHYDWMKNRNNDPCDSSEYCTVLIYLSEITPQNVDKVGGYTLLKINDKRKTIIAIEPLLNRCVMIDCDIMHKGCAPLDPNMLRCSLAFKLKKINNESF
jgi:hypothetical protein